MSWLSNLLDPPQQAETITSHARWWDTSGLSGTPAAGIQVNHDVAMTCATAFACTRAIAETLATLPGMVYETLDDDARRKARQHRMWQLLHDEPNREMSPVTFFETMAARVTNRGNFFAEIERNSNDHPTALWPIHNSRVVPRRDDTGRRYYEVHTDSGKHDLAERDMLNVVGFGSEDGTLGRGVVPNAREELSLDIASQQYGSTWFGNGARPAGMVKHPGFMTDPDRRAEFRRDINAVHSGRENWNKVGVLWEGAEWQNIEVSPDQAQFLGTRQWQSKVLCRFWNVPPAVVQIFEDYKFATVDAMLRQFAVGTIRPLAVRIEKAILQQLFHTHTAGGLLMPMFSEALNFEFLLDALLRGDPKTRAEADQINIHAGVVNQDEIRRRDNMNAIPNGEGSKYWMPLNFAPISKHEGRQAGSRSDSESATQSMPQFDRHWLSVLKDMSQQSDENQSEAATQPARIEAVEKIELRDRPEVIVANEMVQEAAGRMIRREIEQMKAFAKQGSSGFFAKVEEFYDKHEPKMADRIKTPTKALLIAVGDDRDAEQVALATAKKHCETSMQEILDACGCQDEQLVESIAQAVSDWENTAIVTLLEKPDAD